MSIYRIRDRKRQKNMRKSTMIKKTAQALVLGAILAAAGMTSMAQEDGPGVQKRPETGSAALPEIDVEKLDAAQDADQLVLVVGTGMDSSRVLVAYLTRNQDGNWTEQFCVDGFCGYNGMAVDKKEGDRRTPVGTYQFVTNFGILPDPGSLLPYKQVDEFDFWVDDSESRYYNQMVSTKNVVPDWKSAEPLAAVKPQYNYALALNYNTQERTAGKGSAIFLHGLHPWKTWTEGCIAIPEENVKLLMQQLGEGAKIVIMPQQPEGETEQQ